MILRGKHLISVLAAGLLAALISSGSWATRLGVEPNGPEKLGHFSFVRDHNRKIAAMDFQYATDIKNQLGKTIGAYDILMQQCYGGGFLNDITAIAGGSFSFASASAWDQMALNWDKSGPGNRRLVDNFTRAWRESLAKYPAAGMEEHFKAGLSGKADAILPINRDPFAPATTAPGFEENPQYNSAGAVADSRNPTAGTYVIMAAWGHPDERHAINIGRMYHTLVTHYNIPIGNIVILYGDKSFGDRLGPWPNGVLPSDVGGLINTLDAKGFFVDGPNTREQWEKALKGELFTGAAPGAGSHLFIYNTGHGTHMDVLPKGVGGLIEDILPNGRRWTLPIFNQFTVALSGLDEIDSTLTEPGQLAYVQLTFLNPLSGSAEFFVNGIPTAFTMVTGNDEFGLNGLVQESRYSYLALVDHNLLGANPLLTTFEITGIGSMDPDIAAITFAAGDQGYVALIVPEPGSFAVLAIGAATAVSCLRKRRAS